MPVASSRRDKAALDMRFMLQGEPRRRTDTNCRRQNGDRHGPISHACEAWLELARDVAAATSQVCVAMAGSGNKASQPRSHLLQAAERRHTRSAGKLALQGEQGHRAATSCGRRDDDTGRQGHA